MSNEGEAQQRYLGRKGLVLFLAALSAFPALSTDLYLPALPGMTAYFGVSEYLTNLTLILFFIVYAVSMLVWGPLSDRYGRKPILIVGLTCYVISGVLCAVAFSVYQLIVFRILQALGAGASTSTATAVVKDVYHGRRQEVVLAIIQTMGWLSPAIAPAIGALILTLTSWRGAFVAQAILGLIVLAGSAVYSETVGVRLTGHPLASLRRLGAVVKNRSFVILVGIFSLPGMAFMAFIASSPYIYMETFGVSSTTYSLFFALFAVLSAAGAQFYMIVSRWFSRNAIIVAGLAIAAASGLLMLLLGVRGPWAFILTFLPMPVALSCSRPPSVSLTLSQHEGDAGSVAGIMSASHQAISTLGIVIVSLGIWGRVELLGTLALVLSLISLALWLPVGPKLLEEQAAKGGATR